MHESRIVSSESEELILVDGEDRETGTLSKALCHDGDGVLHRAFSVFLFNRAGEVLLQQRSADKRLWPLYWSNACCSHPRKGEDMAQATARRLCEELNVDAKLEFVYKFRYQARFGKAGSENELCWVFLGRSNEGVVANRSEIAAVRWLTPERLDRELARDAQHFTPWLRLEWERLREGYAERLSAYAATDQLT